MYFCLGLGIVYMDLLLNIYIGLICFGSTVFAVHSANFYLQITMSKMVEPEWAA
jgi:hypothetical protein